jgi:hypothetical protein
VASGVALSDGDSGAIPPGVAGRLRFTPSLSAGMYLQWNPAFLKSGACDVGVSCSGYDMRPGVGAAHAFMPDAQAGVDFPLSKRFWFRFGAKGSLGFWPGAPIPPRTSDPSSRGRWLLRATGRDRGRSGIHRRRWRRGTRR